MSRNILPEPPDELKRLSDSLSSHIREEIRIDGVIPFSSYMEMALYQPGLGYYSAGLHKLGESGDFITAPELGSLFAACLAQQVTELADSLGDYDILEVGAGSGQLAVDLLKELAPDKLPGRYRVLERSADLRRLQRQRIEAEVPALAHRVEWLDQPPKTAWQGVLIANEVLDALAVERFQVAENGLEQICVTLQNGQFGWATREAPADLEHAVKQVMAGIETRSEEASCRERV
jgi:SAM-dependent MidA family methyltransferase